MTNSASEIKDRLTKWVNLTWVRLNCSRNHVIPWTSKNVEAAEGLEQWCKRCNEMVEVAQLIRRQDLRIVICDDCRYTRNIGVSKLEAGRRATNHAQSHRGHVCHVYDGNGHKIQQSRHQGTQEQLDF